MGKMSAIKRRVVVTGMGAVSPNGIGREAFWNATRRGQSGVCRITRFDASRHQVQIAVEVTGFHESAYVEPRERQHVSRAVPLAIAAAGEAVTDAGIEPARMSREELRTIGVLIGSGGGSQEFTEEQYRLYYSGHEKQCSVYTIPTSTIGTLASEISMRFGFRGPICQYSKTSSRLTASEARSCATRIRVFRSARNCAYVSGDNGSAMAV
jgi:3-oxoacyl-[acyl-carrier-protein] synthase II